MGLLQRKIRGVGRRNVRMLNSRQVVRICGLAFLMFELATAGFAHHSQSQYDTTKKIAIEGTLQEISWSNPHTLFYIFAKPADDAGAKEQRWIVEGPGPRGLTG